MIEKEPGFYRESLWKYLANPGVNRSFLLDLLETCPGEAQWNLENLTVTDPMRLGDATHAAILEPKRFEREYVVLPDNCKMGSGSGQRGRKATFEEKAAAKGQTIVKGDDIQNIRQMQGVIEGDRYCIDLLSNGEAEVSGYYTEPENGVLCKFRADWINKGRQINVDLKTAADVRPMIWRKSAYDHGYDIQAFSTLRGMTILTGVEHTDFRFICIKSKQYHGLKIYKADADMLASGQDRYFRALEIYARCMETGIWDGYDSTPEFIGVPAFRKEQLINGGM